MKSSFTILGEYIQSKYPDKTLTDYETDVMVNNIVQFFTIGAKMAYNYKKNGENLQKTAYKSK